MLLGKIEQIGFPYFLDIFETMGIPATFGVRGQLVEVDSNAIDCLLNSHIKHDIGGHGYSHKRFIDLTSEEAFKEAYSTSQALSKIGIVSKKLHFSPKLHRTLGCFRKIRIHIVQRCGWNNARWNGNEKVKQFT